MPRTLTLDVKGIPVELPIVQTSMSEEMAVFSLHGEQALTEHCAKQLLPYLDGCDEIIASEAKGLELAQSLARLLNLPRFAVAKHSTKIHILEGIAISVKSSDGRTQNMRLDYRDIDLLRGKKVAIVDAMVSTGGTLKGMETLVEKAGGKIHSRNFVFVRESSLRKDDLNYLQIIPDLN